MKSESEIMADKSNKDQPFDNTLLQRGYLCETRAIHTIAAYGHQVFNRHILLFELKANIFNIHKHVCIDAIKLFSFSNRVEKCAVFLSNIRI